MYHNSERQHLQRPGINYEYDWRKEKAYLDRIAQLMGTNRVTLNSYGKIKLWEDGPNYQKVVKYVNNSQCHPSIKLTVVNIHRVWLRNNEDEDLFHIPNRQLLWHGTKRANIPDILNNGLQLPTQAGQMFGSGIYFADRISKSTNYSDLDVTFLLLCEVGLGKLYSCKQSHNDWNSAPVGFDSVKANGTYVPDWNDNGRYMGAVIPFGRTAKCTKYENHAVNFNEFIVYDPNRIIIRFLVEVDVETVSIPRPFNLVTPRNDVAINKNTRKTNGGHSGNKRNANLAIKTISSTSASLPGARPSSNTITRSNNLSSSLSASAPSTVASNAPASIPLSNNAVRNIHMPMPLSSVQARVSTGAYSNYYSESIVSGNSSYPSSYAIDPVYRPTQERKQQNTCVIL